MTEPIPFRSAALADLRGRLDPLPVGVRRTGPAALPFGLSAIDQALPWGGLPCGALHEVVGGENDGAAAGFCTALLAGFAAFGPVVWIASTREPDAPALTPLGLDPARVIRVEATRRTDKLWALGEALRTPAVSAVVAEIDSLDLTASRRLQLAAEAHGVTALRLGRRSASTASAARTRWAVAASPKSNGGDPGPRHWWLTLEHCRGGTPASWRVAWRNGAWIEVDRDADVRRPARELAVAG